MQLERNGVPATDENLIKFVVVRRTLNNEVAKMALRARVQAIAQQQQRERLMRERQAEQHAREANARAALLFWLLSKPGN